MLFASVLALATGPTLVISAPEYDLHLGLSAAEWQALVSNTLGRVSKGYVVTQELHTPGGDSLVRWSFTPSLAPRGPNALGLQLYGPDGVFRRWLPDTARIDRDYVLCGRYLVGGGNTLRVWDTGQNYASLARSLLPSPYPLAQLKCAGNTLVLEDPSSHSPQTPPLLRFFLPRLEPLPTVNVLLIPLPHGR
ncbi:hypothetical protein DESA109040_15595 [Deinococcus saxicola]|uniref:hypothetical protein n=1 Tax=Deinococcus saxicola TaxID=249406 RepID=UPI0039F13278